MQRSIRAKLLSFGKSRKGKTKATLYLSYARSAYPHLQSEILRLDSLVYVSPHK
ncbi:hypothetical protein [uncultured Helicobacter sp.]|uniref:hypothetical protein n=1 Tax=uncultured Helicobacter sp. TaxID=175537 RepID=UPI002610A02C|nr:hypothetical protein [uncultured Helicobacter sp.]